MCLACPPFPVNPRWPYVCQNRQEQHWSPGPVVQCTARGWWQQWHNLIISFPNRTKILFCSLLTWPMSPAQGLPLLGSSSLSHHLYFVLTHIDDNKLMANSRSVVGWEGSSVRKAINSLSISTVKKQPSYGRGWWRRGVFPDGFLMDLCLPLNKHTPFTWEQLWYGALKIDEAWNTLPEFQ